MFPKPPTDHKWIDISSEKERTYDFPNKEMVRILDPQWLAVSASGGHRVVDGLGGGHYIPPGWIHIYWVVKDGAPTFVA